MHAERTAPPARHVMWAIARRELGIASRRKLVRLLFLGSALPPLVFGIVLVVRLMAEQATSVNLGWDPVLRFLQVQAFPVALLALGLGTPLVARDRSEDVLYLYAVRPVSPWYYAGGKMLAVALPTCLLLFLPGVMIAVLRQGLLPQEVHTLDSLLLVGKVALASLFLAGAYAGVSVGPSAATKRARWALLIAFLFFWIPDTIAQIVTRGNGYPLGPQHAAEQLLDALFGTQGLFRGLFCVLILGIYAVAGALVTTRKVRAEMTP